VNLHRIAHYDSQCDQDRTADVKNFPGLDRARGLPIAEST
jgi:hypothetical protein